MKRLLAFAIIAFMTLTPIAVSASEPAPYDIKMDTANKLTYVYKLSADSQYELMDVWPSTTGAAGSPTILGTYKLKPLLYGSGGEWYYFKSIPCWVNYVTQIRGNYCFHSPPMNVKNAYEKTPVSTILQLLSAKSHGCVRLLPRHAAFMWYNMGGCNVEIYKGEETEETKALIEKLRLEIPSTAVNYPDPVITEHTVYWYTYHGDTVEKICEISGISYDELLVLNPDFDFAGTAITPGLVFRIKPQYEPEAEEGAELQEDLPNEETPDLQASIDGAAQPDR